MDQTRIKLNVLGITFSQVQAGAYALILQDENGNRRVPIIIGTPEAQAIAIFLEGMVPPRPLTHDLFVSFTQAVKAELIEVFIYKYDDGVFFSRLTFKNDEETFALDSRTSDAISIAIRLNAPIYISENILLQTGITINNPEDFIEDIENINFSSPPSTEATMSLEELQEALNEAISNEDYELASQLRDLIKKQS